MVSCGELPSPQNAKDLSCRGLGQLSKAQGMESFREKNVRGRIPEYLSAVLQTLKLG